MSHMLDNINEPVYFGKKRENKLSRKIVAVYLNAVLTHPWQTFSPYKHISMSIEKTNRSVLVDIACFVVMFLIRVSIKHVPHRCELGGKCHARNATDCVTSVS